jgi:hypothetical protein
LFFREDVLDNVGSAGGPSEAPKGIPEPGGSELKPRDQVIKDYVRQAEQNRGDISLKELASHLGISPNMLYKYLPPRQKY